MLSQPVGPHLLGGSLGLGTHFARIFSLATLALPLAVQPITDLIIWFLEAPFDINTNCPALSGFPNAIALCPLGVPGSAVTVYCDQIKPSSDLQTVEFDEV